MSDTPRTDVLKFSSCLEAVFDSHEALERDLAAAREIAGKYEDRYFQMRELQNNATQRAEQLEVWLTDANKRIAELTLHAADDLDNIRRLITERDRYKEQAERKRAIAREFEAELGFTEEEVWKDGSVQEAVRRIRALKANQCEKEPTAWWPDPARFETDSDTRSAPLQDWKYTEPLYRKAK